MILHQDIKNNGKDVSFRLLNDCLYDFTLYFGDVEHYNFNDNNVIMDFTDFNVIDGKLYSNRVWDDFVNESDVLKDFGFTGMDNGLIRFNKDTITNKEFLELLTKSELHLRMIGDENFNKFYLSPVAGNMKKMSYDMSIEEENNIKYISLKGGFYQGFYKIEGFDYQMLPNTIADEWNLNFKLRPRSDYEIKDNTINNVHPENKGIFFYIGTRGENKFWYLYNKEENRNCDIVNKPYNEDDESYITNDYIEKDITINENNISDSEGRNITKKGFYSIISDNKFLMFDRTENGFTTDTWVEGTEVELTGRDDFETDNYFNLFNRTETGYTIDNIDEYKECHLKKYKLYDDIKNNAFCLLTKDDGSIGYRYGTYDCNSEEEDGYILEEEYSKPNMIKTDVWNNVTVKIKMDKYCNEVCNSDGNRHMRIYIYVNGNLVLVSKELMEFKFKGLKDVKERQETVPYNLSIGGGSLGLFEMVLPNYYFETENVLPIERDFCGSFIGDIRDITLYDGKLDFSTIKEKDKI